MDQLEDGTVSVVKTAVSLRDQQKAAEKFLVEAADVLANITDIRVVETLIRLSTCLTMELAALTGIAPTEIITKAARKIEANDD